jgi:hypothetical protein
MAFPKKAMDAPKSCRQDKSGTDTRRKRGLTMRILSALFKKNNARRCFPKKDF